LTKIFISYYSYVLNTTVEMPHTEPVKSLIMRPGTSGPPMAVTTSGDGKFKIWQLADDTDIYRKFW